MNPPVVKPEAEPLADATNDSLRAAVKRPASLSQTFKAVAWSFFGVRRSVDHASDVQKLNPVHVVLAGVASAAIFVVAVVLLVRWVVSSGVAA